jgi:hypothetical protein
MRACESCEKDYRDQSLHQGFNLVAITGGSDALCEVSVTVERRSGEIK